MHLGVDGFESGVLVEEFLELALLGRCQVCRSFAHGGEAAAVVLEFWSNGPCELHEVMVNEAHDVETVGDDPGIGEVGADDVAIRAGEINADPTPRSSTATSTTSDTRTSNHCKHSPEPCSTGRNPSHACGASPRTTASLKASTGK